MLSLLAACSSDQTGDDCPPCAHCLLTTPYCGESMPYRAAEAGEVRMGAHEVARGGIAARSDYAQAFVFEGLTRRELNGPAMPAAGAFCEDFRAANLFDNGTTEAGQAFYDQASYLDLGAAAHLTDEDSGLVVDLARTADSIDPANGLRHDLLYLAGDAIVATNRFYEASIDGSDDVATLELLNGTSHTGEYRGQRPYEVYVPSAFTLDAPTEDQFFAGLDLPSGQDVTFSWTTLAAAADDAPDTTASIELRNQAGAVDFVCLAADDGEIILPHEVIAAADLQGTLRLVRFSHVAWVSPDADGRIDFIGQVDKTTTYQRATAP